MGDTRILCLMAIGVGLMVGLIVAHKLSTPHMSGDAGALLGTIGVLALIGVRYPLQMILLLLFELIWKIIWLVAFALPLWMAGKLDEAHRNSIIDTSVGLLLLLVIPWGYVRDNYACKPAKRSGARGAW